MYALTFSLVNLHIDIISMYELSCVPFLLIQLVPVKCNSCYRNFCLKHRFETDHDCQGHPNR